MKVKIDIDTTTFVRFGLVVVAFMVGLVAVYRARGAVLILGLSLFLALALNPPVTRIARRLPGSSRIGATAIAYILVVGLISGLIFTVVPPIIEQTSKFAQTVPALIDEVNTQQNGLRHYAERYGMQDQVDQGVNKIKQQASSLAVDLGNIIVTGATVIINGALTMIFILVLAFLMLVEGPAMLQRVWGLYEDQGRLERHKELVHRMYRVVSGYVNGQLIVAAIASLCTLATVLILSSVFDMPANLAFAAAAVVFLTGLIPMIGSTVGGTLVGLLLLLNDTSAAVIFVIYFILYQQIENNFISPTIQARTVELSALTVLAAILIGVSVFGLIGGLISIPIAGCARVLVNYYIDHNTRVRRMKARSLAAKPTPKKAKEV